jgi:hypothetical protein
MSSIKREKKIKKFRVVERQLVGYTIFEIHKRFLGLFWIDTGKFTVEHFAKTKSEAITEAIEMVKKLETKQKPLVIYETGKDQ